MKYSEYSVVVIGSGAAGLYAALKIAQQIKLPEGVLLISKSSLGISNSEYAQGGIVGVVHQNPDDNIDLHIKDTLKAGAGLSNPKITEEISSASDAVINDLISNGVEFDRDENGNLTFTLEAAHSMRRILHSGGDATGKGITEGLIRAVKSNSTIHTLEKAMAVELLISSEKECKGVIIYNKLTEEHEIVYSSAVVIATGGAGQVYKYTTNPPGATGDGVALAYEAGAVIEDMEFIQFHPTALALSQDSQNRFLISEAVRGEGAKLINGKGEQFMSKYNDKLELAPRDVVTRAIFSEMAEEKSNNVYLDASLIGEEKILRRFPTITKKCMECGIDITKSPIPVAPAAHYTMGGIKAEVNGVTSIKGLYAIGEAACTELHGANRLASNSLIEAVVYAETASRHSLEHIDEYEFNTLVPEWNDEGTLSNEEKVLITQSVNEVGAIMAHYVGIVRSDLRLKRAWVRLDTLYEETEALCKRVYASRDICELRNMINVGYLITRWAIERKECRGLHFTTDYPHHAYDK